MVREGQERRAEGAGRDQQLRGRGGVGRGPRLAVGADHAPGGPFGRRLPGAFGQGVVEARRQVNLAGPVLAGPPAGLFQEIGAGAQGVRRRVPDVDPAIAVDVDPLGQIFAGLELGLAHGSGPRAGQLRAGDLADRQDAQGVREFGLGPGPAPAVGRQGGQGADDVIAPLVQAVAGLQAPDADQHPGIDAEAGLDLHEPGGLLGPVPDSLRDARGRGGGLDVVAHRPGELRLAMVVGHHPGIGDHVLQLVAD